MIRDYLDKLIVNANERFSQRPIVHVNHGSVAKLKLYYKFNFATEPNEIG